MSTVVDVDVGVVTATVGMSILPGASIAVAVAIGDSALAHP
jgi:hypothetical protein